LLLILLLAFAAGEYLSSVPGSSPFSGKLSGRWALTLLELGLAWVLLLGALLSLAAAILSWWGVSRFPALIQAWQRLRTRLAFLFVPLALLIALYPPFLLFDTFWGDLFTGWAVRLTLALSAAWLAAVLLPGPALVSPGRLALAWMGVAALFLIFPQAQTVNNYPFSLNWSEGNRLYEYSLTFDPGRYQISGASPEQRGAIGRLLLWGLPFLIPNSPLWLHRLWNAILSILPYLALGVLIGRRSGKSWGFSLLFGLWTLLFLWQGPIYTPLILSAMLIVWVVRPDLRGGRLLMAALAVALAGYYAALSRWTWLPAAAIWPVLLLVDSVPSDWPNRVRERSWKALTQMFGPMLLLALAGLGGGLLANPKIFQVEKLKSSTTMAQPLLWYRLFPNSTYPEGLLIALLLAAGPLLLALAGLLLSRRWRISPLSALATLAGAGVLLAGGLVASVKIGGGNNLHNLDMFLVSLVLLAGVALRQADLHGLFSAGRRFAAWPRFAWAAVAVLLIALPAWDAMRSAAPFKLPPEESTRKALNAIRQQVGQAAANGEVLFIDQRQLLTFGFIENTPLVPPYEKRKMMDQAMAGDVDYFADFYADLRAHRFALIVSDMQFVLQKDSSYAFSEENNAWSQWVAGPLLCYYTPLRTMQNVDIQLLVPRDGPPPAGTTCP
jgi:hypothetical protein